MAQRPEPIRPGSVVAGYRIERCIGRGGMGVVYLAEHLHLGRRAALKVIAPELAASEGFRRRFTAEARAAAALRHPNVVGIYDAGEVDGVLYLAMQHVDGRDLEAVLREGALDLGRAVRVAEQVAAALDAAHAAGMVHRDVKPANVLLEGADAFLTDFGLTKRAADLALSGRLAGTIAYASPEQVEGRPVDPRADVYALGCLVFHLLAGTPPFVRDSDVAVLYAQVHEPPPRLSELRPELPAGLDDVLAAALAKRPRDRPASAGAFVAGVRSQLEAAGLLDGGPALPARIVPREGDDAWVATLVDAPLPVAAVGGPAVLVASADPDVRALVRVAAGARVRLVEAADAGAALDAAGEHGPALALLDWTLPGGADAVARTLRGRTRVLAVCDPERTARVEALADGADEVVALPFSPVQLQVRLRRLLGADAVG
jgi:CheY-like chemotaxis protein